PTASNASPTTELAANLLKARTQIGYSSAKNQIAYAVTVEEEGTGTARWHIGFLDLKTSKEVDKINICGDGTKTQCSEPALKAAVPELAKRLEGFVAVSGAEVGEGKPTSIPGAGLTVEADKRGQLSVFKDAKSKKRLGALKAVPPHKPELAYVWYL